jgi:hypothetical protein
MAQFLYNWIMLLCALCILRLLYKARLLLTRKSLFTSITVCLHIDALLCLLRGHTPLMFSGSSGNVYFWALNSYLGVYWVGGVLFNALVFLWERRNRAAEETDRSPESSPEDTQ